MVELYLHSPTRLHGAMFNLLIKSRGNITLPLNYYLNLEAKKFSFISIKGCPKNIAADQNSVLALDRFRNKPSWKCVKSLGPDLTHYVLNCHLALFSDSQIT
jgi:hypothetical protein